MPIVWPAQLPQNMAINDYEETLPESVLRTDMQAGPPKMRKISNAGYRKIKGSVFVGSTQLTDLISFFDTSVSQGSVQFEWKNQITCATQNFRFVSPPTWRPIPPNLFRVRLDLEQVTT